MVNPRVVTDRGKFYVSCVGVDRLVHVCEPHLDVTACGVEVLSKKVTGDDLVNLRSCYPCTY